MERQKKINDAFENFGNNQKVYIDANIDRTLKNHEAFRNLDATKDELIEALFSIEDARKTIFDDIVDLHFKLIELTTEDEWNKISNLLNDMY